MKKEEIKNRIKEIIAASENELALEREFDLQKISVAIYSHEDNTKLESLVYANEDIENDIYMGENICYSDTMYYVSDIARNAYDYTKDNHHIGDEAIDYLADIIIMDSKKYIIFFDGYSSTTNGNSYAIVNDLVLELKSIENVKVFNIENWVCNDESVEYDIIQFPKELNIFKAYQTSDENKVVQTKISSKDVLDDGTKSLIETYFSANKNFTYTFEYTNDIGISDTIDGLKAYIDDNDFAHKYLGDESLKKEVINFFN